MKLMIGIIGTGGNVAGSLLTPEALEAAESVGRNLAKRGAVVVSGAGPGIMEAASKGAHEAGGLTVGFIPGMDKAVANPYIDLPITTGLGLVRGYLTIRASDAVIMISGGIGTLNELTIALGEQATPVVVLEGTGGWADRVRSIAYEGRYLDERRAMPIHFANTPESAVDLAVELGATRHRSSSASGEGK